jgi:hypothetical protein
MPHWKSMMDRDYIFAFDLNGKDVTVEITRVIAGELVSNGGRKTKKPVAFFKGKEKGLALNSTNCKTIAALYGNDTTTWVGKRITLYPTTTTMGGDTVECIRVRPRAPTGNAKTDTAPASNAPPQDDELEAIAARDREGQ